MLGLIRFAASVAKLRTILQFDQLMRCVVSVQEEKLWWIQMGGYTRVSSLGG
jgi:hypothetical protein